MEGNFLFLIIALTLLTLSSAFFSSSEIALFSLSSSQVKAYKHKKDRRKHLIRSLLNKPRDLLVTVFILNTLVNILLQNVASDMFKEFNSWWLKIGVPLIITLVFGEVLPKNLGIQFNETLSYYFSPAVFFFQRLLGPVRKLVIFLTTPISKGLFFFLKKAEPISKEELKHTLKASEKHGVLTSEEFEYVRGYLNFQEVTVREVMRPKSDILYYNINQPIANLIHLFKDKECSRLPVCDEDLSNVKGIISVLDFFTYKGKLKNTAALIPFLTKPFYVTEQMPAKLLLRKFMERKEKFALVVDEYAKIVGLITFEDLAELIIGEIVDLRDEKKLYRVTGDNSIIADGKLELIELFSLFNVELQSSSNMLTIGGWLTEQLGEIPVSGKKYETHTFYFHVLAAEPNRIKQVYIRKKESRT